MKGTHIDEFSRLETNRSRRCRRVPAERRRPFRKSRGVFRTVGIAVGAMADRRRFYSASSIDGLGTGRESDCERM